MAQINRRTFIRVGALTALAACAPGAEDTTTTGAGAAAIGNALYRAVGVRVRELPLSYEQIVKAAGA